MAAERALSLGGPGQNGGRHPLTSRSIRAVALEAGASLRPYRSAVDVDVHRSAWGFRTGFAESSGKECHLISV